MEICSRLVMIPIVKRNWKAWRKIYSRHQKKVLLAACCLGVVFIIIIINNELDEDDIHLEEKNLFNANRLQHHKWMELMTTRMENRKTKLKEVCKKLDMHIRGNDSLQKPNEWEFFINRPFRLIWCNIFKAASTSWFYNFNILAGYKADFLQKSKETPLQLARNKYPRPTLKILEEALNDSVSFLIVRHPFERLVSGYRDKIEHAKPETYHYKLGNYIVTKFRPNSKKKAQRSSVLSFFKKKRTRPTFNEFVQFVVSLYRSGKPLDIHWTPITTFCTPCQFRFDIIMKFETLNDDQNYLIQTKKLQNWIKPQWKSVKEEWKLSSLLDKYYGQLNAFQMYELYNIYKYDFFLFEYKLDKYMNYFDKQQTESLENDFRFIS